MRALLFAAVLTPLFVSAAWGSSTPTQQFPSPVSAAVSALPIVSSVDGTRFVRVELRRSSSGLRAYRVSYVRLRARHSLVAVATRNSGGYWRLAAFRVMH